MAVLSAIAIYVRSGHEAMNFLLMLGVFTVFITGAVIIWAEFGVVLRRLLRNPWHPRVQRRHGRAADGSIVPMVL